MRISDWSSDVCSSDLDVELKRLEALVHPAVYRARQMFLRRHRFRPLVVVDVPLLFETGGEGGVDLVAVVSAPPHVQRARVLARPNMPPEQFAAILAKQMPDAEKRRPRRRDIGSAHV